MILGCWGKDFVVRDTYCGVVYAATAGITPRIVSVPDFSRVVYLYHRRKPLSPHWISKTRKVHGR